jgi:hypothetical protein
VTTQLPAHIPPKAQQVSIIESTSPREPFELTKETPTTHHPRTPSYRQHSPVQTPTTHITTSSIDAGTSKRSFHHELIFYGYTPRRQLNKLSDRPATTKIGDVLLSKHSPGRHNNPIIQGREGKGKSKSRQTQPDTRLPHLTAHLTIAKEQASGYVCLQNNPTPQLPSAQTQFPSPLFGPSASAAPNITINDTHVPAPAP